MSHIKQEMLLSALQVRRASFREVMQPHLVSLSVETSALTLESFCLRMHSVQVRRMELI